MKENNKYKLLASGGKHFLCLEDGTKILKQIKTVVTQELDFRAVVLVTAYCNTDPEGLKYDGKVFSHGGVALGGLLKLDIIIPLDEHSPHNATFEVDVELVDTIVKPK